MSKIIVLDASNGGNSTGVVGNGIIEKDYNLGITNYIAERLEQLEIPYFLTRTGDNNISIDDRINAISSRYGTNNNIIVVSNSLNNENENGIEIIYSLKKNDNLARKLSDTFEKDGFKVSKYYQLRSPSDTSKDYYKIISDTPNYETIVIKYGSVNLNSDANNLKNNMEKYGETLVKALASYAGYKYNPVISKDTYIVKKGDSLYKIAKEFNTTVDELKKINNLTNNNLSIGQVLKIPSSYDKYVVKSGDTLYKIARSYNISVDELKRINNLDNNILSIGQVLNIPKSTIAYTVKSGDTLYKIAREYNIGVEELKRFNNINSNILSIGQILNIPK